MTSLRARPRRDRRQRDWDARLDPAPLGRLAAVAPLLVAARYAARALRLGISALVVMAYCVVVVVGLSGNILAAIPGAIAGGHDGLAGGRQLLVDLGGATLDSSSAAGDVITVAEGVGLLWLMVTFGGLAVLTVTLARVGERTARREAIAAPQVWTRWTERVGAVPAGAAVAGAGCILWLARPALQPAVMLLYEYPLVTWIPALAAAPAAALVTVLGRRHGTRVGAGAAFVLWIACLIALPSLQGRALYEATSYELEAALPRTTQPRLLPKQAAREYARAHGLRHAHLVVDPGTGALVWSAEEKPGLVPRGPSHAIALQPVDRVDGSFERTPVGFDPAVSRTGPGSFAWRTAERHYFTRVEDPAIVPIGRGQAVAVAPYVGYRGFPVRHPYWAGVYVYHQDGTLEDLSPQQALARPELARSGRLYPESSRATWPRPTGTRAAPRPRCAAGREPRSTTPPAIRSRTSRTWATAASPGSRPGTRPVMTTPSRRCSSRTPRAERPRSGVRRRGGACSPTTARQHWPTASRSDGPGAATATATPTTSGASPSLARCSRTATSSTWSASCP